MSLSPLPSQSERFCRKHGTRRGGTGLPHVTLGRVETRQAAEQLEVLKQVLFIFKAIEKQQLQLNFEQVFEKYF